MKIVFIAHKFYPHIGGVEKHVKELGLELTRRGHEVTVVTNKDNNKLNEKDKYRSINIVRFSFPQIKLLGLVSIWYWMLKNRKLFMEADVVHIHDVFIWYLPLRLFYPSIKLYITHHGWEGKSPIPSWYIFLKRTSTWLTDGSICVGKYIEKYYGINADKVIYGAVKALAQRNTVKNKKGVLYVGRLEEDTGLKELLKEISAKIFRGLSSGKNSVAFVGDGSMRKECEKYGKVHGFVNTNCLFAKTGTIVPGGYLAALEAMANKCEVKVYWSNTLKKDYWLMTPFYKHIKRRDVKKAYEWAIKQTWGNMANVYLELWKKGQRV